MSRQRRDDQCGREAPFHLFPHTPSSEAPTCQPSVTQTERSEGLPATSAAPHRRLRRREARKPPTLPLSCFTQDQGKLEVGGGGWQVGGFVRSAALDKSDDGVMAERLGGGSQTGEDLNQLVGQSERLGYPP